MILDRQNVQTGYADGMTTVMTPVITRWPEAAEAAAVCRFFSQIVHSSFLEFSETMRNYYLAQWTEETIAERLEKQNGVLLGAYEGDAMLGIASGTAPEGGVGTITWLLVDERARGSGVGSQLFEAACESYRRMDAHKMKLTAPTENARNFYLRMGMREEGFHPNHWFNQDFWGMAIKL